MATVAPGTFLLVDPKTLEAGVQMVPAPAAYIVRGDDGWILEVFNRAFGLAKLGRAGERCPMLDGFAHRLDAFVASDRCSEEFDWATGDEIDRRYYRVGLGRMNKAGRRCLLTLLDETSRVQTERTLRREMTTDSLTGLLNRTGFTDLIECVGEARAGHAVLVVDLRRFARLNACLGSLAGDELIITVARRIQGTLRPGDTLARIGGDEFGVLMRVAGRGAALAVAERIAAALRTPFRLTDFEIRVECAIGIAVGAEAECDDQSCGAELIRRAQFALKRAKMNGQIETYQPQIFSVARAQFATETALRRAIEERRLTLAYQPICCLSTGRILAFEALARWTDDEGQVRSPNDFIPVAEESGLIVPLGRWALDEAAATLARWDAQAGGHCGVRMAVNVSAIQLQRDAVPKVLARALAAHGLGGDRFTLELTESAIVGDAERVGPMLHELKATGARLAMDDFGTGYSSLSGLQQLPIDILKIDRSFVTGMLADRDKLAIVRAVLSLAQALGKATTAEGVETYALAQTLAALGCTHGQGFHYARPLDSAGAWSMIAAATMSSAIASTRA